MKTAVDKKPVDSESPGPWHQAAVRMTAVSGVFCLIVLALLLTNYARRTISDAARIDHLDRLKIEILRQPDNEELISRIRQTDLHVRQDRIRRLDFSRRGAYLLLAGVAAFIGFLNYLVSFRKKLVLPKPAGDIQEKMLRQASLARWAVTASLAVLALGALILASLPGIDLVTEGTVAYPSPEQFAINWPRFRGPGGLGVSPFENVPTDWNGRTGRGIVWKTRIPLPGYNSPIIWQDRLFLTGADANERRIYCLDAASGKLLWQKAVESAAGIAPPRVMEDTGFAAPTAATDGRRVCAMFAGGEVACFDFNGRRIWTKHLGAPDNAYGHASSLEIYRSLLIIQFDQGDAEDEKSKLIALDIFSGETAWQTNRPVPNSWSSPIVAEISNQHRIVTCANPWVIAYEPATGAEIWRAECLSGEVAPSPIYAAGLVFAIDPYTRLLAIRPDGRGNVTKTHIAWTAQENAPDICSPVSNGELIFMLTTDDGMLSCYTVPDGKKVWEKNLNNKFKASPSLVGDRLYLIGENGITYILQAGYEYKELARCELGEDSHASPAFADGRIYIRGTQNIYCISHLNEAE